MGKLKEKIKKWMEKLGEEVHRMHSYPLFESKNYPEVFCWNERHQPDLLEIVDTAINTGVKTVYEYVGEYYDQITIIVGATSKVNALNRLMEEDFMEDEVNTKKVLDKIRIWDR